MCSYCQIFDHDVNYCPYYDVFDESYARLNVVIETMNEQRKHFISEMRDCGLLHEFHHSLPVPQLRLVLMMILSIPFP